MQRKGQINLSEGITVILIVGLLFLLLATFAFINSSYSNSISEQITQTASDDEKFLPTSAYQLNNTPNAGTFNANVTNQSWANFDGVDDNILANALPTLYINPDNTNYFTISLWFNSTQNNTGYTGTLWSHSINGTARVAITYNSGDIVFGVFNGTTYSSAVDSLQLGLDKWFHVVGVWNGSSTIYLNATAYQENTNLLTGSSDGVLSIGSRPNSANYYNGSIDELRVYTTNLSAADVSRLYGAGRDRNTTVFGEEIKDNNLSYYWSLNAGTGTTAYDSKGGNNGTLSVATLWDNDGIINEMVEGTDYSLTSNIFTPSDRWAYSNISSLYEYDYQTGRVFTANNVLNEANTQISDNTSIAGMILTISLVAVVLTILIGIFLSIRARRL